MRPLRACVWALCGRQRLDTALLCKLDLFAHCNAPLHVDTVDANVVVRASVCVMMWDVPLKRLLRPSSAHLLPRGGECDRSSSESLLNLQHNRHAEMYVRNRLERHCG